MKNILAILCLAFLTSHVMAATVEGQWRTIDDETGEAKSVITLWLEQGQLKGKISSLLNPSEPNPVCEKCKGERKNKPIEGMTIIWGLELEGGEWQGGTILDPSNGKEYKAKVKLSEDDNALQVRGFIGFALIGRTQTWQRMP